MTSANVSKTKIPSPVNMPIVIDPPPFEDLEGEVFNPILMAELEKVVITRKKEHARNEERKKCRERDFERVQSSLNAMYLLKARRLAHSLDRAKVPSTDPQRVFPIAPKWLAEANRVGITHIVGLKLV